MRVAKTGKTISISMEISVLARADCVAFIAVL